MSENRCCCNCRHNIRTGKPYPVQYVREIGKSKIKYAENVIEYYDIENYCEIDGHRIDYIQCFEGWCKHWAKERITDTERIKVKQYLESEVD